MLAVAGGPPRRLYTTQQIEGIAEVAAEEGVAHHKPAELGLTNFTPRVLRLYEQPFPEHFVPPACTAGVATAASRRR